MRAHRGLEDLGVVGGELVGGFPDEVGDLAPGREPLQRRVVHIVPTARPWPGQARPVHVPEVSSVWLWSST